MAAAAAAAAAKSLQSCSTLCDPIDGSQPGSPVPGILHAKVLEWGAIAFSGKSHRHMQFMTRERSLGLFPVSPWRVPVSGSLGLCMATYDITDGVLGTFDLSEPLARKVGDGIFDLSGFCEP